eukprot:CAMPEP_0184018700 /NCGR_PEP_ID=MMETSP0954-20121128/8298_1 /TAXON_ID=627963 /ORGANISM="Aplanochytrium sp, Strain PBS07" /LENGTH=482 /DNA_ID=CAMNT_0026300197 /DNA_START=308 /DNA_END=1756 /DNA_ORIENTATION=-
MRKGEWTYTGLTGALTFIVDQTSGAYYFYMVDLQTYKKKFSHELYEDLNYMDLTAQFHAFEMDDCMCGFNIASADEAVKFSQMVSSLAPRRKKQKLKKVKGDDVNRVNMKEVYGFDVNDISPEWKAILKRAGIRKKDFQKPQVQALIIAILEENGYSAEPPPKLSVQQAQEYYDPQQYQAYQEYQQEVANYESEVQRYNREMEEYRKWEVKQQALDRWENDNKSMVSIRQATLQRVRSKTPEQMQKDAEAQRIAEMVSAVPPPLPERKPKKPELSIRVPAPPALPKLPELPDLPPLSKAETIVSSVIDTRDDTHHSMFDSTFEEMDITSIGRPELPQRGNLTSPMATPLSRPSVPVRPPKPAPKPKGAATLKREKDKKILGGIVQSGAAFGKRGGIASVMLSGVNLKPAPKLMKQPSQRDQILNGIKGGTNKLKHVSVLPTLKNLGVDKQETLLSVLKDRLQDIRGNVGADDSDDESDISDW